MSHHATVIPPKASQDSPTFSHSGGDADVTGVTGEVVAELRKRVEELEGEGPRKASDGSLRANGGGAMAITCGISVMGLVMVGIMKQPNSQLSY